MPHATTVLLASSLVALLACASGGAGGGAATLNGGTAPCDGQRVLVVDNRTGTDVDVVVAPAPAGAPQLRATARPGRQRVPLDGPVLGAHAERNGQRVRSRGRPSQVAFSYACER